ncbi:hypothetical protein IEU95_08730 [Hoyosella rhizosphaerae]|nr:hypothetical protein [Hoyosella rhizosphaerae]MBN4926914.1 hypothetical protein [Hoyosella rhizosphaerae]
MANGSEGSVHKLVRVAVGIGVVFAAAFAHLFMTASDRSEFVGADTVVSIDSFDMTQSNASLYASINSVADESNVVIFKRVYEKDQNERSFYLFGDQSSVPKRIQPGGAYDHFARSMHTEIFDAGLLTHQDVRGAYYMVGDDLSTARAIQGLQQQGFSTSIAPNDAPLVFKVHQVLANTHLLPLFVVIVFIISIVMMYSTLSRARSLAVQRLQGYSRRRVLFQQEWMNVRELVFTVLFVGTGTTLFLSWYNGLNRIGMYMQVFGGAVLGLLLLVVVSTVAGVLLALAPTIVSALKGHSSADQLYRFTLMIKVTLSLMVVLLTWAALQAVSTSSQATANGKHWDEARDYVWLGMSPLAHALSVEEEINYHATFRELLNAYSESGHALLTLNNQQHVPSADNVTNTSGNIMVVNDSYLSDNRVIDTDGHRVENLSPADLELVLLIPESLSGMSDAIQSGLTDQVVFEQHLQRTPIESDQVTTRPLIIEANQERFTYNPANSLAASIAHDPVIVVANPQKRLLSDGFYVAAASRGEILFTDGGSLQKDVAYLGLDDLFPRLTSVQGLAQQELQESRAAARNQVAVLIAVVIASLAAATLLAMLYCERNKNLNFVRRLHGWPMRSRHRALIVTMLAGLLLATGTATALILVFGGSIASVLYLCAALFAAELTLTLTATSWYESRTQSSLVRS